MPTPQHSATEVQKGNKSTLVQKVLMWGLYWKGSYKPGGGGLCHTPGVEMRSEDPENVPTLRALLAPCLGLHTIEASSSTAQLVRFTLQEHLGSDPTPFYSPYPNIPRLV